MSALDGLPLSFPVEDVSEHAFMFFPIFTPDRDDLMRHLEEHGIETRTMMPLTTQPVVREYFGDIDGMLPATEQINRFGLLIGCHQYLSKDDLDYIVNTFRGFFA
jgi:dTDP-4-amino-4,6-dideoxygalactose transaminase